MEKLKKLSREPVVFVKGIHNYGMLKWTTIVGEAYIDAGDNKVYIPIKILGQPLSCRSIILNYKMNLELFTVEKDKLDYAKVETVWPVILFLFNFWVRH